MSTFEYEKLIVDIPDYPEPGVVFKDVTPLFANPQGLAAAVDTIATHFIHHGITKVVGAEARGFLLGAPVAYRLTAGFVPARKPGKLPREVHQQSYDLEYGSDTLEIHKDALTPNDKVLIVDDLIATGGTCVASAKLVQQTGAQLVGFAFLLELAFLHPREVVHKEFDQEIFSLIHVD
ncbi:adenine phosphoribosyltransferase [Atopobium deltae]|uniref:Adenine phosphoribosyltransferase n=1 Tax=Atopobium deltae TaxID=1393034 RepID=A0A133XS80_9ACTN|nr:adenine phosphoribosyltransferase [Atopobium deltae]KXB33796.1 adenine phosphoribosyltransferase [Atopobium deltae]